VGGKQYAHLDLYYSVEDPSTSLLVALFPSDEELGKSCVPPYKVGRDITQDKRYKVAK